MELLLEVGRPRHWLDQVLEPGRAGVRMDARVPVELRAELAAFLRSPPVGPAIGWVTCRELDESAAPPLPTLDELPPDGWIVEFAYERVNPLRRAMALGPKSLDRVRAIESRARAFVDLGLRGVEQWSCAGFPDVAVTVGHRPAQLA